MANSEAVEPLALTDYPHIPGVITPDQRATLSTVGGLCTHWFNWSPEVGNADGTKKGKVPINPTTGRMGRVNDSETAGTFDQAAQAITTGGGVGVLMTTAKPGVIALDFDHVVNADGSFSALGQEVFNQFKTTYIELSPSGTGLRVFALGQVNTERQRGGGVEFYPAGVGRWLRVTGAVLKSTVGLVAACQSGIDWAVSLLLAGSPDKGSPSDKQGTSASPGNVGTGRAGALAGIADLFNKLSELRPDREPEEVLGDMQRDTAAPTTDRARTLKQALKANLAKWSGDASGADFFLFCEVVRRGCASIEDVQTVVEATKLKRDKWAGRHGHLTYLEMTAGNAAGSVLTELQGRAAKGKRAAVDTPAVAALETAGANLARTDSGHVRAGFANIVMVLRHDPEAYGFFGYDLFKDRMYRLKSLEVLDVNGATETGPVTDDDYRRVALFLHRKYGMNAKLDDVRDAVKTVARDERFDAVRDSLEKLGASWDKVRRLDTWLVRYMKIDESVGPEYVRKVSRACLIQAVQRVLIPGSRAETMPVFIGPGGEGKGKAFEALAGAVLPGLFTNGGFDLSSTKDIIEKCRGRLIVEASELDCVKRTRDVSAFKAAMSVAEDTHRKPFDTEAEDFKRTFTIWGSANEEEFITDASNGQGRRVWPLFTLATRGKPIDVRGIERDGGQLWGEAVAAYLSGELSYFDENTDTSPKATDQWSQVIERCRVPDPLDDSLDAYLMEWACEAPEGWRGAHAIAQSLGLVGANTNRVEKRDFHALAEMLKARKLKRSVLCHVRGWVFTPAGHAEFRSRAVESGMTPSAKSKVVRMAKTGR